MKVNRIILILLFLIVTISLQGQSQYTVRGIIQDTESNSAVEGVDVFCDVQETLKVSDLGGLFEFNSIPSGVMSLTFFREGYNTRILELDIQKDTSIIIFLNELSIELTEIQLRARRKEEFAIKRLRDVEGTSIYAGKKNEVVVMELLSGNLANNNSRQIYAQVAGLNVYEGSDGGLQLSIGGRGLDPNRTSNFNTRQNGYDISADVLGYPENYYTPPSEALSEIQIIRGASSLQYGTQFGGLVNFKLRKIPSYKPLAIKSNQTVGSYGLYNTFNYIGVSKNKLSIDGYFNYKRGDGYRPNSNFNSHSINISSEYRFSDKTKIIGEYTHFNYLAKQAGGLTDTQFNTTPRLSTRDRNWFNVNWNLYNIKLDHLFSENRRISLSLFGLSASRRSVGFRGNPVILNENPTTSLDEQDAQGNYLLPRDLIIGDFKNIGAEVKFLNNYRIKKRKAVLLFGGKFYNSQNTSDQGPGSNFSDEDFSFYSSQFPDYPAQSNFELPNRNVALFSENIFYLSDKLSLTPGVRFEYIHTASNGTYNQVIFDNAGNAIANNLLEENKTLSRSFVLLGLGASYRWTKELNFYANISQNYRSVTFSDIRVVSPTFIIDPDISDESGFTADLGVRGRIGKKLSFEINGFNILYDDRIGIILDNRANRVRKNIGKAIISGIESLVSLNLNELLQMPRHTTMNIFTNIALTRSEYIESEENNVVGNRVEFIPSSNIKAGLEIGHKNFIFTSQVSHLSEQFTDVQNSQADIPGGVRSGIIGEIPAYTVTDLSLSYNLKAFSIETGINNALNKNYFTRRATGYPGPGIIPSEGRSFYLTLSYTY
jgi:Fe(3+) dicitrate transport protein